MIHINLVVFFLGFGAASVVWFVVAFILGFADKFKKEA